MKRLMGVGAALAVVTAFAVPATALAGVTYTAGIAKSHTGTFVVGATATFTITLTATLGGSGGDHIRVTDTLPTGLTYNATGSGNSTWTCGANGQVVTCNAIPGINVNGPASSSFPLAVTVLPTAVPSVTNTVSWTDADCQGCGQGNPRTAQDTAAVALLATPTPTPTPTTSSTPSGGVAGVPTVPATGAGIPIAVLALLVGGVGLLALATSRRRGRVH